MNAKTILNHFENHFDSVAIIKTSHYLSRQKALGFETIAIPYPTIVVLGLSYPKRIIKPSQTHLVPSFYTFGGDYHQVLKSRIDLVMNSLNIPYQALVDNHPYNERLAALLGGLGFFGRNQLIISPKFGSYFFLGMVFLDIEIENEITLLTNDSCGSCRKCIDACPTKALSMDGYNQSKCISNYNQSKRTLSEYEIQKNYSLFGCDICQLICPKNQGIVNPVHPEFELSGKELVSIEDLFHLSDKEFQKKYHNMAYLWKGKTILLRNALTLLNNQNYNQDIISAIAKYPMPWFQNTAKKVLLRLNKENEVTNQ